MQQFLASILPVPFFSGAIFPLFIASYFTQCTQFSLKIQASDLWWSVTVSLPVVFKCRYWSSCHLAARTGLLTWHCPQISIEIAFKLIYQAVCYFLGQCVEKKFQSYFGLDASRGFIFSGAFLERAVVRHMQAVWLLFVEVRLLWRACLHAPSFPWTSKCKWPDTVPSLLGVEAKLFHPLPKDKVSHLSDLPGEDRLNHKASLDLWPSTIICPCEEIVWQPPLLMELIPWSTLSKTSAKSNI